MLSFFSLKMEETTTRKRIIDPKKSLDTRKYKIYEEVFIFSCLRDSMPKICDSLSISLRAAILVDLAIEKTICYNNNKLYFTSYNGNDPLLENITKQIMNTEMTPKELLRTINGENYMSFSFNLHVKKLRQRISKKLECAGKIRYSSNKYRFFKGKVTVAPNVKKEIIDNIIDFLENRSDDPHYLAVLVCIKYCGALSAVFFSLPPPQVSELKKVVSDYESKIRAGTVAIDKTILEILKALVTL